MKKTSLPFPIATISRDIGVSLHRLKNLLQEHRLFTQPLMEIIIADRYKAKIIPRKDGGGNHLQKGKGGLVSVIERTWAEEAFLLGIYTADCSSVILYHLDLDNSRIRLESFTKEALLERLHGPSKKRISKR